MEKSDVIASGTASLDERNARMRAALDRVLSDPPETMLDLKRRLAGAFDAEPLDA